MIYAVCGSPGSYKSCYALEKFIIPALAEGKQVYTNIEGLSSVYIATYFDLDPVRVDECFLFFRVFFSSSSLFLHFTFIIRTYLSNLSNFLGSLVDYFAITSPGNFCHYIP